MNKGNIKNKISSPQMYARAYLDYLNEIINSLDVNQIEIFIDELEKARNGSHKIFIAGNGGSAATASHFANDLAMISIKYGGEKFKVMALTDNVPLLSAIANDISYEDVFIEQLKINFDKGDILIVISASGNSLNLVKAAQWMKDNGGKIIGLLGFNGGILKNICTYVVEVSTPHGKYGPVEDIHVLVNHLIATWFQGGN